MRLQKQSERGKASPIIHTATLDEKQLGMLTALDPSIGWSVKNRSAGRPETLGRTLLKRKLNL